MTIELFRIIEKRHIEEGLRQAEAEEFASEEEVRAVFSKWRGDADIPAEGDRR